MALRVAHVSYHINYEPQSTTDAHGLKLSSLCRADKIEEAVSFAQSSLAPLRSLLSSRRSVSDVMLHEVVALLAYENPMVSSSPSFVC